MPGIHDPITEHTSDAIQMYIPPFKILFKLVDYRYNNNKVTIFTSNIKQANLQFNERVVDRITAKTMQVSLPEVAVRSKQAAKEKRSFLHSVGM